MKKLLLTVFALGAICASAQSHGSANVAGKWAMSFDSPHGMLQGDLVLKQESGKLTGSCDLNSIGVFDVTGSVEGGKVTLAFKARGADTTITLNGTMEDHNKMSGSSEPHGGSWTASRK